MKKFYEGLSSREIVIKAAESTTWEIESNIKKNKERVGIYSLPDSGVDDETVEWYIEDIKDLEGELKLIKDAIEEFKEEPG